MDILFGLAVMVAFIAFVVLFNHLKGGDTDNRDDVHMEYQIYPGDDLEDDDDE